MNTDRIKELEQTVAQLRRDVGKLQLVGGSAHRRNPRLALTVADYLALPNYPAAPTPEVRDPETGELITPEGPHARVFPFVFVDATFPPVAGITVPTYEARQNYSSAVNTRTYFAHLYNIAEKYIPQFTLIDVFEDGGKYWTNFNPASGGSPSPPANVTVVPTLQTFWLGFSETVNSIIYPNDVNREPVQFASYPLSNHADMGLERVDSGRKWKSTKPNNSLILHGTVWAQVEISGSSLGTGEAVTLTLTVRHKNGSDALVSSLDLYQQDLTETVQRVEHSFVVPVLLNTDDYFECNLKLSPSPPTNVGQIKWKLNLAVTTTHYDRPIVTTTP